MQWPWTPITLQVRDPGVGQSFEEAAKNYQKAADLGFAPA